LETSFLKEYYQLVDALDLAKLAISSVVEVHSKLASSSQLGDEMTT
jgi:hypothetical protein